MLNQSFRQVFVTNNPTLLADGQTVDNIAVGQVGIVDAKSYKGVNAPTYAKNKAIKIVQGTPDLSGNPLMDGTYDQNEYSKLIVGKNIIGFRGKAAQRGQHQIITIGFSGDVTDTDTIFARNGEQRYLYLTLSGGPIDQLFSKQGITRFYTAAYPINSDCADVCAEVDRRKVAEDFASQINADTQINRFVKASVIVSCDPALDAPTTRTVYKFQLVTPDTQDGISLGKVQSQYPADKVTRVEVQGINSVYEVQRTANTLPAAFSNAGTIVIADCPTCPSGYTQLTSGYVYTLSVLDNGDVTAQDSIATTYGISGASESVSRINYENGRSTYVITSSTALTTGTSEVQTVTDTSATAGTFTLTFDGQTTSAIAYNATAAAVQSALEGLSNLNVGDVTVAGGPLPGAGVTVTFSKALGNVPAMTATSSLTGGTAAVAQTTAGVAPASLTLASTPSDRTTCVLTTPSTTAWVAAGTLTQTAKQFSLTVGDDICGNNRLTELQALYPDYVVAIADAGGDCVHTYTTDVYSNAVEDTCGVDQLSWVRPPSFEGIQWKAALDTATPDGTVCLTGIKLEAAFVNRITNECTFDYFPYDADTVYMTASTFNPNYNDEPFVEEWAVKQIQGVKFPSGFGAHVRMDEKKSLGYSLKERSFDPVVREQQGYSFQSVADTYYDEYSLEYEFVVVAQGWGQKETYRYTQVVYFPEGYGKSFEAAINGYLASTNINLDPVVL